MRTHAKVPPLNEVEHTGPASISAFSHALSVDVELDVMVNRTALLSQIQDSNLRQFNFNEALLHPDFNISKIPLHISNDSLALLNVQAIIKSASESSFLGGDSHNLIGRNINDFLPPRVISLHQQGISKYTVILAYLMADFPQLLPQVTDLNVFKLSHRVVTLYNPFISKNIRAQLNLSISNLHNLRSTQGETKQTEEICLFSCRAEIVDQTPLRERELVDADHVHQLRNRSNGTYLIDSKIEECQTLIPPDTLDPTMIAIRNKLDEIYLLNQGLKSLPDIMSIDTNNTTASKESVAVSKLNLVNLLRQCFESCKLQLIKQNPGDPVELRRVSAIVFSVTSITETHVLADYNYIYDVFCNLISNAIKYTKYKIDVTVNLNDQGIRQAAVIHVSDDGVGLDSNQIDQIFQHHFSESGECVQSHEHQRNGAHVGLSFTKQRILSKGDDLKVVSKGKGMGSTFVFATTFERQSENLEMKELLLSDDPAAERIPNYDILFVEDNRVNTRVFMNMFAKKYKIKHFSSYDGAMRFIISNLTRFKVLVTDNNLKSSNTGIDLIKAVITLFSNSQPGVSRAPTFVLATGDTQILNGAKAIRQTVSGDYCATIFSEIIGINFNGSIEIFPKPYQRKQFMSYFKCLFANISSKKGGVHTPMLEACLPRSSPTAAGLRAGLQPSFFSTSVSAETASDAKTKAITDCLGKCVIL